jgi:hypothetical protein
MMMNFLHISKIISHTIVLCVIVPAIDARAALKRVTDTQQRHHGDGACARASSSSSATSCASWQNDAAESEFSTSV